MFLPLFPSINKLVLQLVAEDDWHLKVLATVAAMGPTKLVLAVVAAVVVAVVAAIVAAVFQRHVVPGAIPYSLNVHVGGTEPRVLDGRCSVSIQEWFFEVALVSRNIFLSFKSVYAFRDRFGFVNGLKQMQVGLLRMKQTGTFDDYIHAFSSSTSQVKYLHDRTRALLFTSGFASDLRKEVFKEYPKKLRTAKRLAREANGTVQLLSSMNTRTTVRNEKNEQALASATLETDASNSLKNRTSASDERPPLMASFPAPREASDERRADWSREDDPDVALRPASQQRTQQGGQRRRNKDYDDEEEEEIEPTEELHHGAHSLVKLVKLAEERDEPLRRSLVHSTTMMWAVGMAHREPERGRARKTSPEGADEERQALVSGGSDDEDIETEMLEESNASARRAMRAIGRSETSS